MRYGLKCGERAFEFNELLTHVVGQFFCRRERQSVRSRIEPEAGLTSSWLEARKNFWLILCF